MLKHRIRAAYFGTLISDMYFWASKYAALSFKPLTFVLHEMKVSALAERKNKSEGLKNYTTCLKIGWERINQEN